MLSTGAGAGGSPAPAHLPTVPGKKAGATAGLFYAGAIIAGFPGGVQAVPAFAPYDIPQSKRSPRSVTKAESPQFCRMTILK